MEGVSGNICSKSVSIHNKNGKGLLHKFTMYGTEQINEVSIHNKNGKGLLHRKV